MPISPLIDKIKMLRVFEHKESFDKYFILICFFFFFFFGLASFHLYRRVGWVSRYTMYCADLFSSAVPLKSILSKTSYQVLFTPILTALFCQRKGFYTHVLAVSLKLFEQNKHVWNQVILKVHKKETYHLKNDTGCSETMQFKDYLNWGP